jgi:hypothetical protein
MQIRTSCDRLHKKKHYSFEHTDSRVRGHCHNALHLFWHFSFGGRRLIAGQQKGYSLECQCFFCKKTNIYYVYHTVLFYRSTRHKRKYQPAHSGTRIQAFREKGTRSSYHNHRSSPIPRAAAWCSPYCTQVPQP